MGCAAPCGFTLNILAEGTGFWDHKSLRTDGGSLLRHFPRPDTRVNHALVMRRKQQGNKLSPSAPPGEAASKRRASFRAGSCHASLSWMPKTQQLLEHAYGRAYLKHLLYIWERASNISTACGTNGSSAQSLVEHLNCCRLLNRITPSPPNADTKTPQLALRSNLTIEAGLVFDVSEERVRQLAHWLTFANFGKR